MKTSIFTTPALLMCLWLNICQAQAPTATVDASTRKQVIETVIATMNERYVFPEMAKKVEATLRDPSQLEKLQTNDAKAFAQQMTDVLRAVTQDRHLRVVHSEAPLPQPLADQKPNPQDMARFKAIEQQRNFGVGRAQSLPGNIGYLELRGFSEPEWASEAIAAAMSQIADTDALIIDLRRNGGGHPATVALVTSYLLDQRTHLNDFYFRPDNRTSQSWSLSTVSGKRYGGTKPVYVLTSRQTFSGGEEFAYNLKNLKRAMVVGETTGGGAHPGEMRQVAPQFSMFVATGRPINPITKTNWEGVGVTPEIKVKADDALRIAQIHALTGLRDKVQSASTRDALSVRIAELEKSVTNVTSAQPAAGALGNTPAAKVFQDWLQAFNSADPAQFKAFDNKYKPNPPMSEDADFRKMTGGFTLVRVEASEATRVVVLMKEKNSENLGRIELTVSTDDQPKILGLEIRLVPPPPLAPRNVQ